MGSGYHFVGVFVHAATSFWYSGVDSDSDPVPPNLVEYALRKPWLWVLTVLNSVRVLFVLWTQHFAKADEAVAEEALSTLVAAYSGFFPFMSMLFDAWWSYDPERRRRIQFAGRMA